MPNFKDFMKSDIDQVFFNADEFSQTVVIDGQEKVVVIDDERLRERQEKEYGGILTGMILYFIPVSAFSQRPSIRGTQTFNGRLMYVEDIKEYSGIYEIIITQNRGE